MADLVADVREVLLVANPISGGGKARRHVDDVAAALREMRLAVHVVLTAGPGDARDAARDFNGDVIFSFGGDGTFNEVLNGADLDRCLLGIIPAGVGNVLAKELGLCGDPVAPVRLLAEGRVERLDLGLCNGRRFICVVGAGIDAHVVNALHSKRCGHLNKLSYAPLIVRQFVRPEQWRVSVEADGVPLARDANLVCIGNTHSYGGPFEMTPAASPTDGALDVMAARVCGLVDGWEPVLASLLRGLHACPSARYARAACIRLTSPRADVPWEVDGDSGGLLPAEICCQPARVRMVVPRAFRARPKGFSQRGLARRP